VLHGGLTVTEEAGGTWNQCTLTRARAQTLHPIKRTFTLTLTLTPNLNALRASAHLPEAVPQLRAQGRQELHVQRRAAAQRRLLAAQQQLHDVFPLREACREKRAAGS